MEQTSEMNVVQAYFDKVRARYEQDQQQDYFNALIYGEVGTGKTRIARTCRKPVLIDSFDPGGTKGLLDVIATGEIIACTQWEGEDPYNPTAFNAWRAEMDLRKKQGVFEGVGTYMLDSATTWSDAIANEILRKKGVPGGLLTIPDYQTMQNIVRDCIMQITALPCDFILTGHVKPMKDEISGKVKGSILMSGRQAITLAGLFDEVYLSESKATSKGVEYSLLTANDGTHQVRTRIGGEGKFDMHEKPDIMYLLEKAGFGKPIELKGDDHVK